MERNDDDDATRGITTTLRRDLRKSREISRSSTRSAGRSASTSAVVRMATFPITALATFVSASLIVGYAGAEGYAAIMVISTLAQLVPYSDLGIGAGVINAIASAPKGSESSERAVVSALRVLVLSGTVTVAAAFTIFATPTWPVLLGLRDSTLSHLNLLTLLEVVLIAMSIPLGLGQRMLTAQMRNPVGVAINALVPILSLALTAAIVTLRLAPSLLVLPLTVSTTICAAIALILASRTTRIHWTWLPFPKRYRYQGLLSTGIWYLIVSVSSALTFQWGRVILASITSLSQVSEFALVMQLYSPLWSFFAVAGTALWPVFARHRADGTNAVRLRNRMLVTFASGGLLAAAALALGGPYICAVLSHGTIVPPIWVLLGCGALVVVQAIQLVQGVYLTSREDLRFQAVWSIPLATFTVAGTFVLANPYGAVAPFAMAALGVALFQIVPNVWRISRKDRARSVAVSE